MADPIKQLVFGPVVVQWTDKYKFPIAVNLERVGYFTTQCPVTYRYGDGDYPLVIKEDYTFDGASIPWIIRIVPGFAKLDWHLLAALPHDYFIENPRLMPRSVADGIFVSVLVALAENRMDASKRMTKIQGYLMFMAVWTWTVLTRIRNPPNLASKPPDVKVPPIVANSPEVNQANAAEVISDITKAETATPPPPEIKP